jgi:polysaccharide pyruvyl transferase WcaK-like protein
MSAKKIALFYGHAASNIGDLAINQGVVNLLREINPDGQLNVVFLGSEKKEFLQAAKSSFGNDGYCRFSSVEANDGKALSYLFSPGDFLKQAGAEDADIILLGSGEHLFQYLHGENSCNLFWRIFPAYVASLVGKPCFLMPSTIGPFEDTRSSGLITTLLGIADGVAVRDSRSQAILKSYFGADNVPLLLDPAFFLGSPGREENLSSPASTGITALVMRSEGWGIRQSKEQRTSTTSSFRKAEYVNSSALQFSLAICKKMLAGPDQRIRIFVQSAADRELADCLLKQLGQIGLEDRIQIYRPVAVDDYLEELSLVDRVVASRFHALIFGLVVGKPAHGVYFDVHGHKMPGLFELLGVAQNCINLSTTSPEHAANSTMANILRERVTFEAVGDRIRDLHAETIRWLSTNFQAKKSKGVDSKVIISAMNNLGFYADEINRADSAKKISGNIVELEKQLWDQTGLAREAEKREIRLKMELDSVLAGFDDVSGKYAVAAEQIKFLKQQLTRELGERRMAEELMKAMSAQLDVAQSRLERACAGLKEERVVTQKKLWRLGDHCRKLTGAVHEAEKRLLRLGVDVKLMPYLSGDNGGDHPDASEIEKVDEIRLTEEPLLRRYPVKGGQSYDITGKISYESQKDRTKNACLATVRFYDSDGIELAPPYEGFRSSETIGAFRYLSICDGGKAVNLLRLKAPDGAEEVELGFRVWAAKKPVYISADIIANVSGCEETGAAVDASSVERLTDKISERFLASCLHIDLSQYALSREACNVYDLYRRGFGQKRVDESIPECNWARADICASLVQPAGSLLDVGSGLGEFINIIACRETHKQLISVDRKDFSLWFDAFYRIGRVYRDIFSIDDSLSSDVVTCFEVLEHLPPERLEEAVRILRSVARRKLYVSVPFMESYPLYKGHLSRFDEKDIMKYFPDASLTILQKDDPKTLWILCEIDVSG